MLQQHIAECGAPNLLHAWRHEVACPVPGIQGRCHSRLQSVRNLRSTDVEVGLARNGVMPTTKEARQLHEVILLETNTAGDEPRRSRSMRG